MLNEVLIIGSQRDYCNIIKEFLELRDTPVTVLMDYKAGIDRLFEDKPALCVIEITQREISPALITKIQDSEEFSIPDFTSLNQDESEQNQIEKNQVLMLDDTSQINNLFDYLKSNLPKVKRPGETELRVENGDLEYTFYPHLIVEIYRKEKTGILSISSEPELNIYFKKGSPVYAEGGEKETMIGRILLNSGRIDAETHRDVLEKSRERKMRFGEVLIDMGIITPHELNTYLELQIEEKVLRGFCSLRGEYNFRDETELPKGVVEYNVKLPKVLNEAVKRFVYAEKIEEVNPQIKLASKPESIINNMELKPKELRMVQLLKNHSSVTDILSKTRLEKYEALKLLYLLGLFKAIELPGVSLEAIGRKSVERYMRENKITHKAHEETDIQKENEEFIELELEVYESERGIENGISKSSEEKEPSHFESPKESITEVTEDTDELSEALEETDVEDGIPGSPDKVGSVSENENVPRQDEADDPQAEPPTEPADEEAPEEITRFDNDNLYEINQDETQNIQEDTLSNKTLPIQEASLTSDDTEQEHEEIEDTGIALDLNSRPQKEEVEETRETPLELDINPEENTQETVPDLFSLDSEAPEQGAETKSQTMQDTPKEISIEDTELFSTFEQNDHTFDQASQIELQDVPTKDEPAASGEDNTDVGDEFSQMILEFYNSLSSKDYYQILDVSKDADESEIKEAYYKLVKDYHPDVNHNIPDDIREKAQEIFTAISAAYETLSDSERRENYDSEEQIFELKTQAQSIYEAELEFKRGQTLLTQRDYTEASAKFAEALKINPDEAAYIGAYAWARYLASDDKDSAGDDMIEELGRAIEINSSIAENYFYLGSIYKGRDDLQKAEQNYEKALQIDPNFIEVKRELRLINTRKRKNTTGRKDSKIEKRFWSSLFKK